MNFTFVLALGLALRLSCSGATEVLAPDSSVLCGDSGDSATSCDASDEVSLLATTLAIRAHGLHRDTTASTAGGAATGISAVKESASTLPKAAVVLQAKQQAPGDVDLVTQQQIPDGFRLTSGVATLAYWSVSFSLTVARWITDFIGMLASQRLFDVLRLTAAAICFVGSLAFATFAVQGPCEASQKGRSGCGCCCQCLGKARANRSDKKEPTNVSYDSGFLLHVLSFVAAKKRMASRRGSGAKEAADLIETGSVGEIEVHKGFKDSDDNDDSSDDDSTTLREWDSDHSSSDDHSSSKKSSQPSDKDADHCLSPCISPVLGSRVPSSLRM